MGKEVDSVAAATTTAGGGRSAGSGFTRTIDMFAERRLAGKWLKGHMGLGQSAPLPRLNIGTATHQTDQAGNQEQPYHQNSLKRSGWGRMGPKLLQVTRRNIG